MNDDGDDDDDDDGYVDDDYDDDDDDNVNSDYDDDEFRGTADLLVLHFSEVELSESGGNKAMELCSAYDYDCDDDSKAFKTIRLDLL